MCFYAQAIPPSVHRSAVMAEQTRLLKQAPSLFWSLCDRVTPTLRSNSPVALLQGWCPQKACIERSDVVLHTTVHEDKSENGTLKNTETVKIVYAL